MDSKNNKTSEDSDKYDFERLLEERAKLDSLLEKKFVKQIAVMFTDLQDSTSLAESEGDLAIRLLIKRQNGIMFPIIEKNGGVLVKTMGDGTLSYFKEARSAIRAAVQIQIKGKKEVFKVFKAFWNEIDLEEEPEQFSETSVIHSEDSEATMVFSAPGKYKLVALLDQKKYAEYKITEDGLVIGRLKTNNVSLADKSVSRQHARIWCKDDEVYIEDLGSRNGTFVDG